MRNSSKRHNGAAATTVVRRLYRAVKNSNGSTLVAVIASMLFIGIVTAAMLRNTGSQAMAASAYGGVSVMNSTIRSAMVATEGFFANPNNKTAVEEIITDFEVNKTQSRSIFPSGSGARREKLDSRQFFGSNMIKHEIAHDNASVFGVFDVKSGRSDARDMRKAVALLQLQNIVSEPGGGFPSDNAIYSAGGLQADIGLIVKNGNATFDKHVTMHSNTSNISFEKKAYFADGFSAYKDIEFMDEVFVNGNAEFHSAGGIFRKDTYIAGNIDFVAQGRTAFEGKTHIGGNALIRNTYNDETVFKNDISIGGNLELMNNNVNATGNFYLHGDFTHNSGRITNTGGTDKKFLYSATTANTDRFRYFHGDSSGIDPTPGGTKTLTTQDMQSRTKSPIPAPTLDVSKIRSSTTPVNIADLGGNQFDFNKMYDMYNTEAAKTSSPHFYGDHLVVEIDASTTIPSAINDVFDGKVIFIVTNDAVFNVGMRFYDSGNNASTLMIVENGGSLAQFGLSENRTFRGLIYVDESSNNHNNSFHWGNNTKIVGALHMHNSDMNLQWNSGHPPEIVFDRDVLDAFGSLVDCDAMAAKGFPCENTVITATNVEVRPIGYYFH